MGIPGSIGGPIRGYAGTLGFIGGYAGTLESMGGYAGSLWPMGGYAGWASGTCTPSYGPRIPSGTCTPSYGPRIPTYGPQVPAHPRMAPGCPQDTCTPSYGPQDTHLWTSGYPPIAPRLGNTKCALKVSRMYPRCAGASSLANLTANLWPCWG